LTGQKGKVKVSGGSDLAGERVKKNLNDDKTQRETRSKEVTKEQGGTSRKRVSMGHERLAGGSTQPIKALTEGKKFKTISRRTKRELQAKTAKSRGQEKDQSYRTGRATKRFRSNERQSLEKKSEGRVG